MEKCTQNFLCLKFPINNITPYLASRISEVFFVLNMVFSRPFIESKEELS